MNAMSEAVEARNLVSILIEREFKRNGDRMLARQNVARSVGAAPGTIENLQRQRLKKISGWLRDALRARAIRELEQEVVRLQHELSVLKSTGVDSGEGEVATRRASLSEIMAVLGRQPVTAQ